MKDIVTDDDKLWAALAWVLWPVAIFILLNEDRKQHLFQRYHAVNALVFAVAFSVAILVISIVTLGIGCCLSVAGLVVFYWAFQAYQGEWVEIPWLTNFAKEQGWL